MPHGLVVEVHHAGLRNVSILLSDVFDATDAPVGGPVGPGKAGGVYVPVGGSVTLSYTGDVAKSFESGAIRQFVILGEITASLVIGSDAALTSLGNYATNREAWLYIAANNLDTNGDGTGLPVTGTRYYNTTYGTWRTWNGTIWEGRPQTFHYAASGPEVDPAGDDKTGDGSLTYPYATLQAAQQDIAEAPSGSPFIFLSAGTHTAQSLYGGEAYLSGRVAEDDPVFAGGAATDTIAVVVSDINGLRRVTMSNPGTWGAGDLKSKPVTVSGGLLDGARGWIYDNDGTDLWLCLEPGFGDPTYGLAPGDSITVQDFPTTLRVDTDVDLVGFNIRRMRLGMTAFARIGPATASPQYVSVLQDCVVQMESGFGGIQHSRGLLLTLGAYFWGQTTFPGISVGLKPDGEARFAGAVVFDGEGLTSLWDAGGPVDWRLSTRGMVVTKQGFNFQARGDAFSTQEDLDLYLHDTPPLFAAIEMETTRSGYGFPAVFGTILQNYMIQLYGGAGGGDVSGAMGVNVEFRDTPNATSPLGTNVCSIDGGVSEGYYTSDGDIRIEGTGNDLRDPSNVLITSNTTLTPYDGAQNLTISTALGPVQLDLPPDPSKLDPTWILNVLVDDATTNNAVLDDNGVTLRLNGATIASRTAAADGERWLVTTNGIDTYYLTVL